MGYIHHLKEWVEQIAGLHIYRTTLPFGADLHHDLSLTGFCFF